MNSTIIAIIGIIAFAAGIFVMLQLVYAQQQNHEASTITQIPGGFIGKVQTFLGKDALVIIATPAASHIIASCVPIDGGNFVNNATGSLCKPCISSSNETNAMATTVQPWPAIIGKPTFAKNNW